MDHFDTTRFYLGRLCRENHEWDRSGKSLRRLPSNRNGECVICHRLRSQRQRQTPQYQEYQRYYRWLQYPKVSPTVLELVEREARNYFRDNRYRLDPEDREKRKARYRQRYYENVDYQRSRVRNYKYSNPDRVKHWQAQRWERIKTQSDGSLTEEFLTELINKTKSCLYCSVKLTPDNASIDHLIPVALGGLNSTWNVVACCRRCNARKQDKPFDEWLNELPLVNKEKAEKLYRKRYGSPPTQITLPLKFN